MWGCGLFLILLRKEMMYKPLFVRNEVPPLRGIFASRSTACTALFLQKLAIFIA